MKNKLAAVVACALAFPGPAFAGRLLLPPIGFSPASNANWLAGTVAGYNWQRGTFVFGFEGDMSGTGLRSETTGVRVDNTNFVYASADAVARIGWYGTARARAGWTNGMFLVYGTGGLAYGNVSLTNNFNDISAGPLNSQTSGVRVGWVAGAGVEYSINRNLSLNFEYQYVDLGTLSLVGLTSVGQAYTSPSATVHAQFQAVTIGLKRGLCKHVHQSSAASTV